MFQIGDGSINCVSTWRIRNFKVIQLRQQEIQISYEEVRSKVKGMCRRFLVYDSYFPLLLIVCIYEF